MVDGCWWWLLRFFSPSHHAFTLDAVHVHAAVRGAAEKHGGVGEAPAHDREVDALARPCRAYGREGSQHVWLRRVGPGPGLIGLWDSIDPQLAIAHYHG
jgi:hypothetical protein